MKLKVTKYSPNLTDPRVAKRIAKVLVWCGTLRISNRPKYVGHTEIQEVFGNVRQAGLSQWLAANLLRRVGTYKVGGHPYSYELNVEGHRKISALLGVELISETQEVKEIYGDVIAGTAALTYADKGNRRYHPIQNITRDIRRELFVGWWDYDIESSAPSLVLQFATRLYREAYADNQQVAEPLPAISKLVGSKTEVRRHIANLLEVDVQTAKGLLTAIFFGAPLSPHRETAVFRMLGANRVKHAALVADPFVKELRRDAKKMWSWAKLQERRQRIRFADLTFEQLRSHVVLAARTKQAVYVSLEREVMDVVVQFLDKASVRYVLMHDGFMASEKIDIVSLVAKIFESTQFVVAFSELKLEPV